MNKGLDIMAKMLGVLFYPLFVPTYGMAVFCYAFSLHMQPLAPVWISVAVAGTFFLTGLLPLTAIWLLMRKGEVTDLQIEDPKERTIPYLYAVLGFAFWNYLVIRILHAPDFLSFVAIGATVAIAVVAWINRFWKISAHLTGMGGLTGGLMSYCLYIGAVPTWGTVLLWFGLSWAVMLARLRLNAHTPLQVCAGWLLGITTTFIPYCIFVYAV